MSSSARHTIKSVLETVYGTTPATPNFKAFRNTGTTLAVSKETVESEELRPDRQLADQRHGTRQVGGDINAELSFESFDDQLEAVLCGTWADKAAPVVGTGISIIAADQSVNFAANDAPLVVADDVITIAGFTGTAGNNQKARVVSRTAAKIIVVPGTAALVDDAAGESVTISTNVRVLKAGTVRRSFTITRLFGDIAADSTGKPYHRFTGCEYNRLDLSVAPNAMVGAVFGIIGQDGVLEAADFAGANNAAPTTSSPMDSFSGALKEGGTVNAIVTEISQTLENGLEVRNVVGQKTTIRPSIDKSMVSGTVGVYFEDASMLSKFYDEIESSISFIVGDVLGQKYRVTYPRVKYNGGQPDVSGQPSVILSMPFQSLYDSVTQTQIIIEKIQKITA